MKLRYRLTWYYCAIALTMLLLLHAWEVAK